MNRLTDEQLDEIYTTANLAAASVEGMHSWLIAGLRAVADAAVAAYVAEMGEPVAWANLASDFDDEHRAIFTDKVKANDYHRLCYDLTPVYAMPKEPK